ncbi:jg13476 [Pararge aegeria aegeria]|uniref:Jg13476 protein n=1 Tax=Pararge aegeria aegeria TaxID=348720 RepID=A0A8S4RLR0_9NEOP|nr:jg13476 [Pararge aegeria aegeria]
MLIHYALCQVRGTRREQQGIPILKAPPHMAAQAGLRHVSLLVWNLPLNQSGMSGSTGLASKITETHKPPPRRQRRNTTGGIDDSNDWVWEWSSRPDQLPPKDWRFKHPQSARGPPSATSSIEVLEQLAPAMQQSHCLSVRRSCLFSRGAIAAVLVTNIVSLLLGAGIGVWLSKKGMLPPRLIILN